MNISDILKSRRSGAGLQSTNTMLDDLKKISKRFFFFKKKKVVHSIPTKKVTK